MKIETAGSFGFAAPSKLGAMIRFLIVGFTGIAVNEIVYVGLVDGLAVWFVLAAVISTEASTTWNFLGNERWAFAGRKFVGPAWVRYLAYAAMNNALLVLRVPMLWALTDVGHLTPAWSNLIALGALFAMRFLVSDGWVWRRKGENPFSEDADVARGAAAFRYDISSLIRLDSDTELPELAYFRTAATTEPDIRIKVRRVGLGPRRRVRLHRNGDKVTYREHLGVLGADFNLKLGTPIEIEASPLLALSRHVLYTNVVEALLRFVLVSKGYVLLHSAGMEVDGKATLLSAQTDTGKTSTVINMIRQRGWGFISDDMAIVDPAGRVMTFPKPMTLSFHTMTRAVDADTLGTKQRLQLQIQSRLHSKSGRSVGQGLGSMNVPIMSINSVVQLVVPPPKYHITSLLPARITPEAPIANVFFMERGEPLQERVPLAAAIDQLIENTDDAYGFPPFATLAPNLVIDGMDYMTLRARERELLTQAVANATIWRLRVRGHEWGDLLPRLILGEREPVGIQIEPEEREPVGIPVEADTWEPVGIPIVPDVSAPIALPIQIPELLLGMDDAETVPVKVARSYGLESEEAADGTAAFTASNPELKERRFPFGVRPAGGRTGGPGRVRSGPGRESLDAPGARPGFYADTLAISPYGRFGMADTLPQIPDLAGVRERTLANIRASWRVWLSLVAILAAGTLVRLWAIGSVGFNNDEAVYAGQGASLAGDPTYSGLFAIFRAHPLLLQFLYSISFRLFGVNDVTPRLVSVGFGLAGIALIYATGKLLYGRRVGLIAAALLSVMPYHVVVTRQALLDGPETTLFLLSMYLLSRYARDGQGRWLYGAAFATGLTVLAKETAVLIVPVAIAFLLLVPEVRVPVRRMLLALGLFILAFIPYPAAILIGKATSSAGSFVLWQILRQPNHTWTFYGEILPGAIGPLVFIAGALGLLYAIRRGRWEDRLLFCWIAVPVTFFEIWPVKGYQYLLPIAPAIAILAGLAFDRLLARSERARSKREVESDAFADATAGRRGSEPVDWLAGPVPSEPVAARRLGWLPRLLTAAGGIALAITIASVAVPSVLALDTTSMSGSLAGTGGLPGARDTGVWIKGHVPAGATFLTVGPTMANIVEFYGQRRAYALSVSPNPLRRNPAYDPIDNPDRALQLNQIQYVATDIWSAQRSPFFDQLLRHYVSRYHGVVVYSQSAQVRDSGGNVSQQVVIQIFEVRP